MLIRTLTASLLGNMLAGKRVIRAGKGEIRAGQDFSCCLIFCLILNCSFIIKMNPNLMVQEMIYLRRIMGYGTHQIACIRMVIMSPILI